MCPKGWTEVFDGNKDGDGAPCILHKYDDGFFGGTAKQIAAILLVKRWQTAEHQTLTIVLC